MSGGKMGSGSVCSGRHCLSSWRCGSVWP
jgi:hypothetical protein